MSPVGKFTALYDTVIDPFSFLSESGDDSEYSSPDLPIASPEEGSSVIGSSDEGSANEILYPAAEFEEGPSNADSLVAGSEAQSDHSRPTIQEESSDTDESSVEDESDGPRSVSARGVSAIDELDSSSEEE